MQVPELNKIFKECLEKFPELKDKDIQLAVFPSDDTLEAAKGTILDKDVVILRVHRKLWGCWNALRPLIYHGICHFIDLENPQEIFMERADEKSKELWKRLEEAKLLECKVEK